METNKNGKVNVKITATDRIGRTESIKLSLNSKTAKILMDAASMVYPDGSPCTELKDELNRLMDICRENGRANQNWVYFTRTQYYKIRDFLDLVFHKFYNYTLDIK